MRARRHPVTLCTEAHEALKRAAAQSGTTLTQAADAFVLDNAPGLSDAELAALRAEADARGCTMADITAAAVRTALGRWAALAKHRARQQAPATLDTTTHQEVH